MFRNYNTQTHNMETRCPLRWPRAVGVLDTLGAIRRLQRLSGDAASHKASTMYTQPGQRILPRHRRIGVAPHPFATSSRPRKSALQQHRVVHHLAPQRRLATDDERPLSATGADYCVCIPMAVLADYLRSSYKAISIN